MARVYLSLGSNLGDKEENLKNSVRYLSQLGEVLSLSAYFYSKPQGFESENDFVNQAVLIDTLLTPLDLLHQTQEIEKKMGRLEKSAQGYSDRVIDIDILMYDNLKINLPELTVPHPRISERVFVTEPLKEIYEAATSESAE